MQATTARLRERVPVGKNPYASPYYVLYSLYYSQRLAMDVERYIEEHTDEVLTRVGTWREYIKPYDAKRELTNMARGIA